MSVQNTHIHESLYSLHLFDFYFLSRNFFVNIFNIHVFANITVSLPDTNGSKIVIAIRKKSGQIHTHIHTHKKEKWKPKQKKDQKRQGEKR